MRRPDACHDLDQVNAGQISETKLGRKHGAPGRTRTSTPSRATDFESAASTSSATGALKSRAIIGQPRAASIEITPATVPAKAQKPFSILAHDAVANVNSCAPMNVAVNDSVSRMATIFGMKVRVISWTCVSAWNRAIEMPTTMATSTAGPLAAITVQFAARRISSASTSLIC